MTDVTDRIFFGGPFVRWTLGTTAFVTSVGFAFLMSDLRGMGLCAGIAFEAVLVLLFLAMVSPVRCAIAARGVCALVFLAFVAYVIDMGIHEPDSFWPPSARRSQSTGYNAVCGLVVIGLPALLFAIHRRGPRSPEDELAAAADDDDILAEEDELTSDRPR
jgi:hypothetical protein